MTREPPSNSRSLSDRIRNLSRAHGLAEGRVRRLLGVVVIGQLLVRTDAAVLKGATNLEVRLGTAGHVCRATLTPSVAGRSCSSVMTSPSRYATGGTAFPAR
jgi:hypothetical protein